MFPLRDVPTSANQLLVGLPGDEIRRLRDQWELVTLPRNASLFEAGNKVKHLYFPTSGVISLVHLMSDGRPAEVAVVGNEGMLGVCMLFGRHTASERATVRCPGQAFRMKTEALQREFDRCGPLHRFVLRYAQSLIGQLSQTAACNRHHALDQQLCRWLLTTLDRLPSGADEMRVTQELIANMLGVRREGVTEAARRLQDEGLIRYSRGRISVLSRPKLEARACECYALLRNQVARLRNSPQQ